MLDQINPWGKQRRRGDQAGQQQPGSALQAGARDRQRRPNTPISAFNDTGAFDASAVADAGLGHGDMGRHGLDDLR